MKFTSTIAGASILITVVAIASRGLGFLREIFNAGYFGLSREFDVYLVSSIIPLTFNTIIYYIGQNYFIPLYNNIDDREKKDSFLDFSLVLFLVSSVLIASLLYLINDNILNLFNIQNSPLRLIAKNVFNIYLITIPFSALIAIYSAYLQVFFDYKSPALSQIYLNLIVVILLNLLYKWLNIYVIPVSFLAGTMFQTFYLFKKIKHKVKPFFSRSLLKFYFSRVKSTLAFILLIEFMGQLYLISDRYFFSKVDNGGIAALNYAVILFNMPIAVFSMALSTALFPKFSSLFSKEKKIEFIDYLTKGTKIIINIFTPIFFLFFFFGKEIIQILFERGRFSAADTLMTSQLLKVLGFGIIFYSIYGLLNKILYSMELIKELFYITVIGCALKIMFNFLLVESYKQNGLAVSTVLSYVFFFTASSFIILKNINYRRIDFFISELFFCIVNGICSLLISGILLLLFGGKLFSINFISIATFFFVYLINFVISGNKSYNLVRSIIELQLINKKG